MATTKIKTKTTKIYNPNKTGEGKKAAAVIVIVFHANLLDT